MTITELVARVTRAALAALALVAAAAWLAVGGSLALGVVVGGGVALLSFRALGRLARATTPDTASPARPAVAGAVARHAGAFAALSVAIGTGAAHPLGVAAGVAVLPPVLLAAGLRHARSRAEDAWT